MSLRTMDRIAKLTDIRWRKNCHVVMCTAQKLSSALRYLLMLHWTQHINNTACDTYTFIHFIDKIYINSHFILLNCIDFSPHRHFFWIICEP